MISYDLGDGVPLTHLVKAPDANGRLCLVDATVVLELTAPDTSHPTADITHAATGVYTATPIPDQLGEWSYRWQVTGTVTDVVYGRFRIVDAAAESLVTPADIAAYLGANSYNDLQLQDAIDAESAAQAKVCNVPSPYPRDLREALKRRVARNLAMRPIPLAVLRGDAEAGESTILPGTDPEIRRLEKPYLWLLIA